MKPKPHMSEARRKVRQALCKSKGDPHYFSRKRSEHANDWRHHPLIATAVRHLLRNFALISVSLWTLYTLFRSFLCWFSCCLLQTVTTEKTARKGRTLLFLSFYDSYVFMWRYCAVWGKKQKRGPIFPQWRHVNTNAKPICNAPISPSDITGIRDAMTEWPGAPCH